MNSNLNINNENLHGCLFSTSDMKHSRITQTFCHKSQGILSREACPEPDGKNNHENFFSLERAVSAGKFSGD